MSKEDTAKKVKGSDIVLVVTFDNEGVKEKRQISGDSFSLHSFKGKTIVKGDEYYIKKAVSLGAKEAK